MDVDFEVVIFLIMRIAWQYRSNISRYANNNLKINCHYYHYDQEGTVRQSQNTDTFYINQYVQNKEYMLQKINKQRSHDKIGLLNYNT